MSGTVRKCRISVDVWCEKDTDDLSVALDTIYTALNAQDLEAELWDYEWVGEECDWS